MTSQDLERLDSLAEEMVSSPPVRTPPMSNLRSLIEARRRRRRVAGLGAMAGLALVGVGTAALWPSETSGNQTVTVADDPDRSTGLSTSPSSSSGDDESAAGEQSPMTMDVLDDGPACGDWPTALQLWPDAGLGRPDEDIADNGQMMVSQTSAQYRLEILWPPNPVPDYDLSERPETLQSWWTRPEGDDVLAGFDPDGSWSAALEAGGVPGEVPELVFLEVQAEDLSQAELAPDCRAIEVRIYEGEELLEHVAYDLNIRPSIETVVIEGETREVEVGDRVRPIDILPIVTDQIEVDELPGSVLCSGVLVGQEIRTFRVSEPLNGSLTIAEALAAGQLAELDDPFDLTATADPNERWMVLLPEANRESVIDEMEASHHLTFVDAGAYEDFVDPEIGPRFGPGVDGVYESPIEALKAFFQNPAAETFIKSGLTEMAIDDDTVAYGVPEGHGRTGWITVIATERGADGWSVTGWTSAGC